jgi:streptomycin 6-kinase
LLLGGTCNARPWRISSVEAHDAPQGGQDEISGLGFWNGNGTIKLLEADLESGAMLIERCLPGTTLPSEPEPRQDEVVANLLKQIWSRTRNPSDLLGFRPLSLMIELWCRETIAQRRLWPDTEL